MLRDELAERIAEALATFKAYDLPGVVERLGLPVGDPQDAWNSKRLYVLAKTRAWSLPELQDLGERVLKEVDSATLREQLDLVADTQQPTISRITRLKILEHLDRVGGVSGSRDLVELLESIWPIRSMQPTDRELFRYDSLADEIWQHTVRNEDWPASELFRVLGLEQCSQRRFFRVLEEIVDPRAREGADQQRLVEELNERLRVDGYELAVVDVISGHPIFRVVRRASGVGGGFKQLIFAADGPKPDLVLADAISNYVLIVKHAEHCLVYDRAVGASGLTWRELVEWWGATTGSDPARRETELALYKRLRASLASRAETRFFQRYFRRWREKLGERLPALVPQVYLHYDPLTARQRAQGTVLPRQRMDFLILFSPQERVVIEIDGKHHYADGDVASPARYADMVAADRDLRLAGYEIYRFGGAELLRADADATIDEFFERLFAHRLDRA